MSEPIRILHIEDDDAKARAIARMVGFLGGRVGRQTMITRESTLAMAAEHFFHHFDLVITDWCFPPGGGNDSAIDGLGAQVLEEAERWQIPAVVISGGRRPPSYGGSGIWVDDWQEGIRLALETVQERQER